MSNFEEYISIGDALFISVISIATVFIILIMIALIISLIGKLLKEEKSATVAKVTQAPVAPVAPIAPTQPKVDLSEIVNDEHKRIAVMVATIAANDNDQDKKYKITSIKEI